MNRYFMVYVDHTIVTIVEIEAPLGKVDWQCRTDGIVMQYRIRKDTQSPVKNWFERGTYEVQYHAQNESKTGFVLWDKRPKNPVKISPSRKAAQEKMRKLL